MHRYLCPVILLETVLYNQLVATMNNLSGTKNTLFSSDDGI